MKITYRLNHLCCGTCAAKIERAIQKLPGVTEASLSFITQKLYLETETEVEDEIKKIVHKIEPDCTLSRI